MGTHSASQSQKEPLVSPTIAFRTIDHIELEVAAIVAVVLVVASRRRTALIPTAPLVIAAALAAAILLSGPVSGGSWDPAGALAPMIVSGTFAAWWVYLLAPLIGGCAAVTCVRAPARTHVAGEAAPSRLALVDEESP